MGFYVVSFLCVNMLRHNFFGSEVLAINHS